jgi:hypothetical protein
LEREELYIKYRLYFSRDVIDSIYNELQSISKLIRYGENLGSVVDRYLSMLQKLKQCEEEQNEIANKINTIHQACLGIKREGVSILQIEGKLISYLRVLSKNERNSVGLLDLGLGDIINDINKEEWYAKRGGVTSYAISDSKK